VAVRVVHVFKPLTEHNRCSADARSQADVTRACFCRTIARLYRKVAQNRTHGPDLILRQFYDHLTIMPKLRSTYDGRLIHKTSYIEWKASHR